MKKLWLALALSTVAVGFAVAQLPTSPPEMKSGVTTQRGAGGPIQFDNADNAYIAESLLVAVDAAILGNFTSVGSASVGTSLTVTGDALLLGKASVTGHLLHVGPTPSVANCGGADATIAGSDFAGHVVVGSAASAACEITFAAAYGAAPVCIVAWSSGPLAAMSWVTAADKITVTQTATASNTLDYICTGKQ